MSYEGHNQWGGKRYGREAEVREVRPGNYLVTYRIKFDDGFCAWVVESSIVSASMTDKVAEYRNRIASAVHES